MQSLLPNFKNVTFKNMLKRGYEGRGKKWEKPLKYLITQIRDCNQDWQHSCRSNEM